MGGCPKRRLRVRWAARPSRREGTVLFLSIDPARDPTGAVVRSAVASIDALAAAPGVRP